MTARGHTWGQVVMVGMVLLFEDRPVTGTAVEAWISLALWAHAVVEAYGLYGQSLVAELELPPILPPADPRLLSLRDGIRGLFPLDAQVGVRTTGWGALKAGFGTREGG